jgi:hypothetical protein
MNQGMYGEAPKMFKLGPSTDGILSFRVSKDASYAVVALQSGDLNVYKVSVIVP